MNNSETIALVAQIDAYYDRKIELIRQYETGEISTLEYNTLMDDLEDGTSFMKYIGSEEEDEHSGQSLYLLNKWSNLKQQSHAY